MNDYDVNQETGEVDFATKEDLKYMKLYPYVLLCLTVIGAWTNICWEMSATKRSAKVNLINKLKKTLANCDHYILTTLWS